MPCIPHPRGLKTNMRLVHQTIDYAVLYEKLIIQCDLSQFPGSIRVRTHLPQKPEAVGKNARIKCKPPPRSTKEGIMTQMTRETNINFQNQRSILIIQK